MQGADKKLPPLQFTVTHEHLDHQMKKSINVFKDEISGLMYPISRPIEWISDHVLLTYYHMKLWIYELSACDESKLNSSAGRHFRGRRRPGSSGEASPQSATAHGTTYPSTSMRFDGFDFCPNTHHPPLTHPAERATYQKLDIGKDNSIT